jgi:hypothetical protein
VTVARRASEADFGAAEVKVAKPPAADTSRAISPRASRSSDDGIGMTLDAALNLFQWDRVAMVLVAIFAVVVIAEIVVTQIRKRIL